jgi:hypothetical protein
METHVIVVSANFHFVLTIGTSEISRALAIHVLGIVGPDFD